TITDSKHPLGFDNSNNFYVFGFSDSDLQNYLAQQITSRVPEPMTALLFLVGLAGVSTLRRTNK
ncbi:MAG: PEP-CTERM sorting domain-containing protein, partial [Moraxellaceae bacterium]